MSIIWLVSGVNVVLTDACFARKLLQFLHKLTNIIMFCFGTWGLHFLSYGNLTCILDIYIYSVFVIGQIFTPNFCLVMALSMTYSLS